MISQHHQGISCRVRKQIRQFDTWAEVHSPGSSLEFLQNVYHVAQGSQCIAHALEAPAYVGRARQCQVTLEAYGPQGNPMTLLLLRPLHGVNVIYWHVQLWSTHYCSGYIYALNAGASGLLP